MNNWNGPTVKQIWNYAIQVLHNFFGFNINTTAFCLGQSSLHLLLLKSSMIQYMLLGFQLTHDLFIVSLVTLPHTGVTINALLFKNTGDIQLAKQSLLILLRQLFTQVIKARFGRRTHIVYCCFAIFTNIVVMLMLMLAGTAVLTSLVKVAAIYQHTQAYSIGLFLHSLWHLGQ